MSVKLSAFTILLIVLGLSPSSVSAQGAAEAVPPSQLAPLIVLSGNDERTVTAVTVELQAAGFRVATSEEAGAPGGRVAVVALQREEDRVALEVRLPERLYQELISAAQDGGMPAHEALAIRVVEVVRSLLTSAPPSPPAPPPVAPPPSAPPPSAMPPGPHYVPYPPPPSADEQPKAPQETVLRIGAFGGVGYLNAGLALGGLSIKGQLSSEVFLQGMVFGSHAFGAQVTIHQAGSQPAASEGNMFHVNSIHLPLLIGWEPLGADTIWSPSLGGGLYTGLYFWHGVAETLGLDEEPRVTDIIPWTSGSALGLGPVVQAGLAVLRPLRIRLDVLGGVQGATQLAGADGDSAVPTVAPFVIATAALELDVWTREPSSSTGAASTAAAR